MQKIDIVIEHEDFIVVYKPEGVSFHSEQGEGLVRILSRQLGYALFPVHRLDKVTSGLILFAKSTQAAAQFTQLFSAREIDKYYLALTKGKPKKKQGWVKGDMAKSRRGTYKLLQSRLNPAITRLYSQSIGGNFRAWIIKPFSGKTHQIRVALKSLGAPIIGDEAYAGETSDRVYLHAYGLEFVWCGEKFRAKAEPNTGVLFKKLVESEEFKAWCEPSQLEW
ncbi:TIGR01621 family pseudouridine synthase [Pseudoalteromonas sp. T1lg65]|uniref:TIGR01621 family pseudouridine synthase n=1 Tax=Pseudoalteromonas sp. T1lg65 TaxID=2077101 RepID=UPI003F7B1A19